MDKLATAFDRFPSIPGAYIVGGAIRDILLDRPPADYDAVVLAHPRRYAAGLASLNNGRVVVIGKATQRIYRVVCADAIVDVSSAAAPTIEADLARRDFTINALAFDLEARKLIDVTGGLKDLADRTIRMVAETAFTADPIRLLRAYRLGAQLRFTLAPGTADAVGRYADRITASAGERIRYECLGLLQSPVSGSYLQQMAAAGLLAAIFPERRPIGTCGRNTSPGHPVCTPPLEAYLRLENLLDKPEKWFAQGAGRIRHHMTPDRTVMLKWAMLLHDIGKPATNAAGGNARLYAHGRKGAEMVETIGRRLRMSIREMDAIGFIVRHHLSPLALFGSHISGALTRKKTMRFFIECRDHTPDMMLHGMADMMGEKGGDPEKIAAFGRFADRMINRFFEDFRPRASMPPLITGHDLITAFGLSPSPLFHEILTRVEEARLTGQAGSRKAALALVAEYLHCMGEKI